MRATAITVLIISLIPFSVFASYGDAGTAGAFLYAAGPSARSAGLANSCSSEVSDASGAYFNPALAASVKYTQLTFYYMQLYDGVGFSDVSFAFPVAEYGILAFQRAELSVDGIERITSEGVKTGDFSDKSSAYLLTYAYPFDNGMSLGLTTKLITRQFDTNGTNGFGVDTGISYDSGGLFSVALSFLNVMQPSLKTGTDFETYPLNIRTGAALHILDTMFTLMGDVLFVNALSDGRDYQDNKGSSQVRYSGGIECKPLDFTALRFGISDQGFAAGAGITTKNFTIDYAASFTQFNIVHNFGVTALFGEVPTEREKILKLANKGLELEKSKLAKGIEDMSVEQLYLSALNDFNTARYDAAEQKIKKLRQSGKMSPDAERLAADLKVAMNRKAAGLKFDEAAELLLKGDRDRGLAMVKDAEKMSQGIGEAKIREYLDAAAKNIENRRYPEAKLYYQKVLAYDPSNAKAAEMLDKLQGLIEMLTK